LSFIASRSFFLIDELLLGKLSEPVVVVGNAPHNRPGAPRFLLEVFFSFGLEAPASPRRRSRGPRLGLRCVGQALATEAIAECARSGSVGEAESNIELLDFVSTPAAPDWDALFTVERINL